MQIYHIGDGGHLDLTDEVDDASVPIPSGWTRLSPPSLKKGEYAVWGAGAWHVSNVPYVAWVAPPPGTEPELDPVLDEIPVTV